MSARPDEFAWIDSLRGLCQGDPRALDLRDDAAVLPARPGYDLVISKDAMVEGVHVLPGENPEVIARRLLRTSLSDLAAKGAEPFGYFLLTAWPPETRLEDQARFAAGLEQDGALYGVALLGGDTVSTPGPLTVSATVLGWVPAGQAILRSGARVGDRVVVCGHIGDGWLGLQAALGRAPDPDGRLANHYRLPTPLLSLRAPLRTHAHAAADVSDGLLADAMHIATASGLGLSLDLDRVPLSVEAAAWCAGEADPTEARLGLAAGGDDYALVCAIPSLSESAFIAAVRALGVAAAEVGAFEAGDGLEVRSGGQIIDTPVIGWRH